MSKGRNKKKRKTVKCYYCNNGIGKTRDHILPRTFIDKVVSYSLNVGLFADIPNNGYGDNVVWSCEKCNSVIKRSSIYFPTRYNLNTIFKFFTPVSIIKYSDFLWDSRRNIGGYLKDNRLKYEKEYNDWIEFIDLYSQGYFNINNIGKVLTNHGN